jgi:NhaP-type Na+/H+ or K+/H+ antiporter
MELSTEILIMLFLLMLAIMGGHFLRKRNCRYLQESGLTTLIGVAAGLFLKSMDIEDYTTNLSNHFVRLFMILLLPPIIFESGFNMQKKHFFRNLGTISVYAFLGTFIAIIASSVMFYTFGYLGFTPAFTMKESCAFGAFISSTDPVAVLAIFKEMNADITLYTLIFGESIFNDAIAIVMYRSFTEIKATDSFIADLLSSLGSFMVVFLGSVMIGAFSALLIAFILKRQSSYNREQAEADAQRPNNELSQQEIEVEGNIRPASQVQGHSNTEISLMILCPWVSYLIAEGLELSGIVSIMVNGIFLSYYAQPNISISSRRVLKTGYETVAHSCETLVFIFLGLGLSAFNHPYDKLGWATVPLTILNLSVARVLNIGIVSFLVNKSRQEKKISFKFQFVMWLAGLRGSMAYALALKSTFDFEKGPIMLIDTLIYAFVSILIVGSLMNPVLSKLDVSNKPSHVVRSLNGEVQHEDDDEDENYDRSRTRSEGGSTLQTNNFCLRFKRGFSRMEQKYFSPLFIR